MLVEKSLAELSDALIDIIQSLPDTNPNLEKIAYLLDSQKLLNIKLLNQPNNRFSIYEATPLIVASQRCLPQLVSMLIKAGADPNLAGNRNKTALMYAIDASSPSLALRKDTIKLLIESSGNKVRKYFYYIFSNCAVF